MKVLVVEDNYIAAMAIVHDLRALNCEVTGPIATVARALEVIQNTPVAGALLDYQLRDGTSVDVARELYEASCPFYFMTGYSELAGLPELLKDVPRLNKPVDARRLRDAVEQFRLLASSVG